MSNKPTHYLTIVHGDGDNAIFTRVAPLWRAAKSATLSGTIPPGLTITGRIVITGARTSTEATDRSAP